VYVTVYFGLFSDADEVTNNFNAPSGALDGAEVLLAWYEYEDYSGDAFVLYEKDGKLYEVNGSHCSCDGLEDQWDPEETTWEALAHIYRKGSRFGRDDDASRRLRELIDARVPVEAE
jgi:hypothetical protein